MIKIKGKIFIIYIHLYIYIYIIYKTIIIKNNRTKLN